jgi:GDP-4-dehydro-6-deoxy-D-mannose reductase
MRALITGIAGFVGAHLARALLAEGIEVWGTVHRRRLEDAELAGQVALLTVDLTDPEDVTRLVDQVRPDWVFHLAARSSVAASWADPVETFRVNVTGQLNLLRALVASGLRPQVLVPGSAEEYGLVKPGELPVREENPLRPTNPYAVSKIAQDFLGYQFFLSHGLPVVRIRAFNQVGPGQSPEFVVSGFAKQIAAAEAGLGPPEVRVGNLEARRDFTDVRDMVRAYILAVRLCQPGDVYNVGRGVAVRVGDLLERLCALSRIPVRVVVDPARFRPLDVPETYADARKFRAATGWEPQIPLEQSLAEVLEFWRAKLRRQPK